MNAHQEKLVKLIQQAGTRYESWKVFSDFTNMMACDISTHCDLRTREEREEQYLHTIKSYDKETQALFPQMCAELVLALTFSIPQGAGKRVVARLSGGCNKERAARRGS